MRNFNQYLLEATKAEATKMFGGLSLWDNYSLFKKYPFGFKYPEAAKIWAGVYAYISYSSRDPSVLKALQKLHSYKKFYPNELEPDSVWAFRGLRRNQETLKRMNLKWRTFDDKWMIAKGTYTNKTGISSWTTKETIAWGFAHEDMMPSKYKSMSEVERDFKRTFSSHEMPLEIPVLMQVKVDDDFLFNTSFTNKIARKELGKGEYEITRLSKKPIAVEYFIWKEIIDSLK